MIRIDDVLAMIPVMHSYFPVSLPAPPMPLTPPRPAPLSPHCICLCVVACDVALMISLSCFSGEGAARPVDSDDVQEDQAAVRSHAARHQGEGRCDEEARGEEKGARSQENPLDM